MDLREFRSWHIWGGVNPRARGCRSLRCTSAPLHGQTRGIRPAAPAAQGLHVRPPSREWVWARAHTLDGGAERLRGQSILHITTALDLSWLGGASSTLSDLITPSSTTME